MGNTVDQVADIVYTPTRELATFSSCLRYEDIPAAVVEKTKVCVLDSLGCVIFGSTLAWTRMVADMAIEQGGEPQALILGTGERTSVSQAVLVNGTAGHSFEFDDSHIGASMHPSSINVPTALALGEWLGNVSGREFITSIVAGYEVGLRVGIAAAGNLFNRGFHSGAVCGVFAAAAVAGRILRLDAEKTQQAFGIAGSLAAGLMAAQEGAMVKRLYLGRAAQAGVYGALLAHRGFTGIPNVLEAPFGGFFSTMTNRCDIQNCTSGLGATWEALSIGFKQYATAGATHASLEALDHIMHAHNLSASDIDKITVYCSSFCHRHVAWPYVPRDITAAQMNIYYALAVMALERAATIEQFSEKLLQDPRIMTFIPRIEVEIEPKFDAMGSAFRLASRIAVRTVDQRTIEREVLYRPGTPNNPMTDEKINEKFVLLAKHGLPEDRLEKVIALTAQLEELENISDLIAVLASSKKSTGQVTRLDPIAPSKLHAT